MGRRDCGPTQHMKAKPTRYLNGLPVVETDFLCAAPFLVDVVRPKGSSEMALVIYWKDRAEWEVGPLVRYNKDRLVSPPTEDEITRHVRFPGDVRHYAGIRPLMREIESFLAECLDLDEQHRFLLTCFVLSTWVVDRLPVAPYVALVGLPGSGKTAALSALHLICRRGLLTSDISSAALYRASDGLTPTLFLDETATAGPQRTLLHLLRSGTTPGSVAFREGHSYRNYGAKVFTWTEMPNDDALNSRCVIIPMHETGRTGLLRPTQPRIIAAADELQAKLQLYRFQHYDKLKLAPIPGAERLRGRARDLYEALAMPIGGHVDACVHLLECFESQQGLDREPLPPSQLAVLESLFKQIHAQPEQEAYRVRLLTEESNLNLAASGERFRVSPKAVGDVLRNRGFRRRSRTKSGCVVLIDRVARRRVHEILSQYGIDDSSSSLPSQALDENCEFCKPHGAENHEVPIEPWMSEDELREIEEAARREILETETSIRNDMLAEAWESADAWLEADAAESGELDELGEHDEVENEREGSEISDKSPKIPADQPASALGSKAEAPGAASEPTPRVNRPDDLTFSNKFIEDEADQILFDEIQRAPLAPPDELPDVPPEWLP